MRRSARHQTILDLITRSKISRQDELVGLLRAANFRVTQASVSRDLDQLGIVKSGGFYTRRPESRSSGIGPVQVRPAGDNLIVVITPSGLASAAAVLIDAAGIQGIVGTIAGDDTIFIAVDNKAAQARVQKDLAELF